MLDCNDLLSDSTPGSWRTRAALGGAVWLAFVAAVQPGWAEALLLLAPLVAVPLGLALLIPAQGEPDTRSLRLAALGQLPAALVLLGVFLLPAGPGAAALALPWLGVTGLLALAGLARLRQPGPLSAAAICRTAALLYPVVGGGWLILSALGARPLGFAHEIVRATAIHFHYAGFALPLLAGRLAAVRPGPAARVVTAGVVLGVPLVALGITLSAFEVRLPEWLAAWSLAAACIPLGAGQLALSPGGRGARLLLAVSGVSLLAGMALAAAYAWGSYWGPAWLDIPLMLRTHGVLNALGFALPGLLAWNLVESAAPVRRGQRVGVVQS
jgi:hypothetical protein